MTNFVRNNAAQFWDKHGDFIVSESDALRNLQPDHEEGTAIATVPLPTLLKEDPHGQMTALIGAIKDLQKGIKDENALRDGLRLIGNIVQYGQSREQHHKSLSKSKDRRHKRTLRKQDGLEEWQPLPGDANVIIKGWAEGHKFESELWHENTEKWMTVLNDFMDLLRSFSISMRLSERRNLPGQQMDGGSRQ